MRCAEPWGGSGWHMGGSLFPVAPQVVGGALPIPAVPPKLSPAAASAVKGWGWDGGMCLSIWPTFSPLTSFFHWMCVRCGVFCGALCDLGCSSC